MYVFISLVMLIHNDIINVTNTERHSPLSPFCSLKPKIFSFITHLPINSFKAFYISHNYNRTILQRSGPLASIPETI